MKRRHETPLKRVNPSGKIVWVARWTDQAGKRHSAGTYDLKREAQAAIDAAYEKEREGVGPSETTVEGYLESWLIRHPRTDRTNGSYTGRIRSVLDVRVEGTRFREWPLADLKRRHALVLVDAMLREHGRAYTGAQGVLRSLSALMEDAITDERAGANPFKGVKIRSNDPRIRKARPKVRVWSWADMHRFARAAGTYEGMVRVISDCGLRLGEVLPLMRADLSLGDATLEVRRTTWQGRIFEGTKTDHGEEDAGRVVPLAPELVAILRAAPARIDSRWLFPTPHGRLWLEANWRRDVWAPAQKASGMDIRPHEMRHSFVTHMRAAGVNDADLSEITGHTVATMIGRYTHALGRSFDDVRGAVG